MTLTDIVSKMEELTSEISNDLKKGLKGNKAASQRVRVNTILLAKIAKQYRKESVALERKSKQ